LAAPGVAGGEDARDIGRITAAFRPHIRTAAPHDTSN
jgi:hypothetical protein